MTRTLIVLTIVAFVALVCLVATWLPINAFFSVALLYIHIPCAILCYLAFISCIVLSVAQIFRHTTAVDNAACVAGEAGIVFGLCVLATGSVWGAAQWGTFWVWEPRTTATLITVCVFIAWRLLRDALKSVDRQKRATISAATAILGLPCILLTHFAVTLFGGIHPQILNKPGAIDAPLLAPVLTSLVAIGILAGTLSYIRWQSLKAGDTLNHLQNTLSLHSNEETTHD